MHTRRNDGGRPLQAYLAYRAKLVFPVIIGSWVITQPGGAFSPVSLVTDAVYNGEPGGVMPDLPVDLEGFVRLSREHGAATFGCRLNPVARS